MQYLAMALEHEKTPANVYIYEALIAHEHLCAKEFAQTKWE